jgi:hypothetical protein
MSDINNICLNENYITDPPNIMHLQLQDWKASEHE